MQHAIFISYRRDDAPDAAGRLYDRLATAFGEANVFKDVDTLPVGENFGDYIAGVISKCRVALALIGPGWAISENVHGRRLQDPSDWVRVELESALTTPSTKVIPVLVGGATMLSAEQVPKSLHPLLRLNAANVRRDPDFHRDMEKLIATLSRLGVTGAVCRTCVATVWSKVKQTEDIELHCHFIENYPQTEEAFEARLRVDQLRMLKLFRQMGGYLDHFAPEPEEAASCALLLVEGTDIFRGRWVGTHWDTDVANLRDVGFEYADEFDLIAHDTGRYEDARMGFDAETPAQWLKRADQFFAKLESGLG